MKNTDPSSSFLNQLPRGEPSPCSYLPGKIQENQEFFQRELSDDFFGELLAQGFRHFGSYFFRYACSTCSRCLPIRIPVASFQLSRSQKRILNKAKHFRYEITRPTFTLEKLKLYQRHLQQQFNKNSSENEVEFQYAFTFKSLKQTHEFIYYDHHTPIAHGFVDILPSCLSSIYFFYDPDYAEFSLGTYSLLCELEYALTHHLDYLYLGYYIYENPSMRYKAEIRPSEVYSPFGTWTPFRTVEGDYLLSPERTRCQIPLPERENEENQEDF
jgi:arginyl-tRNA--protein-N-Asp/Glu arginylyltransferase